MIYSWLNRLQNLNAPDNIFVTLNPPCLPDPKKTYHCVVMGHPQFTLRTMQARTILLDKNQYQGKHSLWYCGAWSGYGFHEDGMFLHVYLWPNIVTSSSYPRQKKFLTFLF
jgi:predicted NAD/FAD-binding protein